MIIECPHCYTKVIPKENGDCPSCGKNTNYTESDLTIVAIGESKILPEICCICGNKSDKYIFLRRVKEGASFFFNLLLGLFSPILYSLFKSSENIIELKLPICNKCKKEKNKIKIEHVDFGEGKISIVVHKRFKQAL